MKTIHFKIAALALILLVSAGCQANGDNSANSETIDQTKQVKVYFLDEARYAEGTEPYEVGVDRSISTEENEAEALLRLLFDGPTEEESSEGLRVEKSGCTGFNDVQVSEGIARVNLTGDCQAQGSTYTIANLIFVNLKQLEGINYVKIFDQFGETAVPEGNSDSIPFSLEP